MKKMVMALLIVQVGFVTTVQAGQKVAPISLEEVCRTLAQSELPGSCTAECEAPDSYGQPYVLKLVKGPFATKLLSSENDPADRTIVNANTLLIQYGKKGTNAYLEVIADRANKIQYVSVNQIECK